MLQNLRGRGVHVDEFKFTAATNDRMTNTLHVMLRDGLVDLPDHAPLLDELLSVRVVETRLGGLKVDTLPGKHDDQVDALGIVVVTLMDRSASNGRAGSGTSAIGYIPMGSAADRLVPAHTNPLIDDPLADDQWRRP